MSEQRSGKPEDFSGECDCPLLVTMSAPDAVRIALVVGPQQLWVEGSALDAERNAWSILDSVRLAYLKAGRSVPFRIAVALGLLEKWQTYIPLEGRSSK